MMERLAINQIKEKALERRCGRQELSMLENGRMTDNMGKAV